MDHNEGSFPLLNTVNAPVEQCEFLKNRFLQFLNDYICTDEAAPIGPNGEAQELGPYYVDQLQTLRDRELTTLYINFSHVREYDMLLAQNIEEAYYVLEPFLRQAVYLLVRERLGAYADKDDGTPREFWVSFNNLEHNDRLRELRSAKIGKLSQFVGTVTRTTEVRPELYKGTFRCLLCSTMVAGVEQQFKYTQPAVCPNATCGNRSVWSLSMDESQFVDWQKVKVQESPEEVPAGSLPRTLEVILRGDAVESVRPGDRATFTGALVVVPDVAALTAPGERLQAKLGSQGRNGTGAEGVTGLRAGPARTGVRELSYRLSFLTSGCAAAENGSAAVNVRADDSQSTAAEVLASLPLSLRESVRSMRGDPALYERLADSLAPNVWGHRDVKRAVLLMLLGGVPKTTPDGAHLRGDINVAIVGDPACAKSQILKYVSAFLPRAVYTSGKASSAAGLTASVVREPDSGEFCIEAGALMLADSGICCIDEFDKMDPRDAVAIHEAMEQQTLSVAKAGLHATLNARASVLAAANPVGGRYDRSRPLRANVALPPALLSRFDLLHVMVDEPDPAADRAVAAHLLDLHRGRGAPLAPPYAMHQAQAYLRVARAVRPRLGRRAAEALVAAYKQLRGEDAAPGTASAYRITVRQLEALVRLSEALARLRMREAVSAADVREAHRLVKSSIVAVDAPDAVLQDWGLAPDEGEEEEGGVEPRGEEVAGGAGEARRGDEKERGRDELRDPSFREPVAPARRAEAPARTRVPQQKFDNVKNLVVMRLAQAQRDAEAQEEPGDEAAAPLAPAPAQGLAQRDLLKWYFERLVDRGAVLDHEAGVQEIVLAEKIIGHLVKKEQVLLVVQEPEREQGEGAAAFARRLQNDRVLALHPNYAVE